MVDVMVSASPLDRAWLPVLGSDDLGVGPVGVTVAGRPMVLFRDADGAPALVDGRCPHRGTLLELGDVIDGAIRCPYHGWRFDRDGTCVSVPSQRGPVPAGCHTTAWQTTERDGLVWACPDPDAPVRSIPGFVDAGSIGPGLRLVTGEPVDWATSAGRVVENMLDVAHFPWVHTTTFGTTEAEVVAPHEPRIDGDRVRCDVDVVTANPTTPDGPLYPDLGPTITLHYRYEIRLPYRVTLSFAFPDGMRRVLHEVVAPTSPTTCRMFWALGVDERLGSDDADELAFALRVFAEDRPIVESQPPGVPVARTAEVHVAADRLAVAYRRALREWGVPEEALV